MKMRDVVGLRWAVFGQTLAIGLRFKMVAVAFLFSVLFVGVLSVADTYAAGTASVKDFGVVGDGVTDDADAIIAAFASDNDTITFPEGEYLFNKCLTFGAGNKTVVGEKAVLFTDDSYNMGQCNLSYEEWAAVHIRDVDNIVLEGLRFEARQTEVDPGYKAMIGVQRASEIHIDKCDIATVRDTSETMFSPIDFWGGWHNVSVKNSRMDMLHDNADSSGGGVAFRDIVGWGASGGEFTNNVVYKYGRDEIFWVSESQTTAMVEDVVVSGNRFYVGDPGLVENVYTIGFEAAAAGQLKNIRIFDNEIIGQGRGRMIEFEGAEDVDVYDNDLYTTVSSSGQSLGGGGVIGSREVTNTPNTPGTVRVRDNRTITLDSGTDIVGVTYGTNPYDFTGNRHVTINAPNVSFLVNHVGSFSNNSVTLNGNVYNEAGGGLIGANTGDVRDNTILVNGSVDVFIRRFMTNLAGPAVYTGNHITSTKKLVGGTTNLARMWAFSMNGYPIIISDNVFVNGSEVEGNEGLENFTVANTGSNVVTDRTLTEPYASLWVIQVGDAVPADQSASICNNVFRGFRTVRTVSSVWPTVDLECAAP